MNSTTKTKVVNLNKEKYDVYIGRAGRGQDGYFGSPIALHKPCPICDRVHKTNMLTIPCYKKYVMERMSSDPVFTQKVKDLKGKTLGCFCKPKACHGDVLVQLAEEGGPTKTNIEVPEVSNTEETMTKSWVEIEESLEKPIMKYYAGIGSRETPPNALALMTACAKKLDSYVLRSGGAKGADRAFEAGVSIPNKKQIFLSEDCTEKAKELSGKYHPAWDRCSDYAKKLHGRNAFIILGSNLDTPVDFVLCWTSGGQGQGGTGQAIRIAKAYRIPVFDMGNNDWKEQVALWKQDPKAYVDSVYPEVDDSDVPF